ncbi:sulfotransferase family protein [Microbulbifer mangrovi]|uniref:sulfotransferase family protein n=1 Tax=Microbulbifer mangrovi TaxID=927787 RepID=UPI0009903CA1|nr:sulfotransferase [Microbulbifer mangrovi]
MNHESSNSSLEIKKEFRGKQLIGYWYYTLRFARGQRRVIPGFWTKIKTRIASFSSLPDPIFILGSPRSGTTYLGELLEDLPESSYFFEPPILKYLAQKLYKEKSINFRTKILYKLIFRSLLFFSPGTGRQIIEKNPNNTFIPGELLKIYPNAKFVVINRDGLDVATSLLKKPWHLKSSEKSGKREPGGYLYGAHPHFYIEHGRRDEYQKTTDVHRCIWVWKRHHDAIQQISDSVPQNQFFTINYEDLVRNPDNVLPEMVKFLGIHNQTSIEAALKSSKRGKIESIGNGKSYLSDIDFSLMKDEASALTS